MNATHDITEALIDEITRYLAAVDVFRSEECEPTWLPEPAWNRAAETAPRLVRSHLHATH
jgi:hypothetical protein